MTNNKNFHNEHMIGHDELHNHMNEDLLATHTCDKMLKKMGEMSIEEIVKEHMELLKNDEKHSDMDEELLKKHIEEMVKAHSKEDFEKLKCNNLTTEDIIKLHHQE